MKRIRTMVVTGGVAATLIANVAAQPRPALEAVLIRAGVYVLQLQQQLAGIVAEEDYVQDVKVASGFPSTTRSGLPAVKHRELKSDLLLVRPVNADRWVQFRDVFEVDGRPVRDRSERLMKLFVSPSSATADQAEQIAVESSRYNIGNLQRTVNLPVLALARKVARCWCAARQRPRKRSG